MDAIIGSRFQTDSLSPLNRAKAAENCVFQAEARLDAIRRQKRLFPDQTLAAAICFFTSNPWKKPRSSV